MKIQDLASYAGSDRISPETLNNLGSIKIEAETSPIVKAGSLAYLMFSRPNLEQQQTFFQDFGMLLAERRGSYLYMRGYGPAPYIVCVMEDKKAAFLGAGFSANSAEDLQTFASATNSPIEDINAPGGGRRVRVTGPGGFWVDLVYGQQAVEEVPMREQPLATNTHKHKQRLNGIQRPELMPSPVYRLGHLVLSVTDFIAAQLWYQKHLGLIASDVQCLEDGTPMLAFNRLDLGEQPADHHSLALVRHLQNGYAHSAYETVDLDAIGMGHQYLRQQGWEHFWGIGRHILGSQIFDYWKDPYGQEFEHYADGDVFDNRVETNYQPMSVGGLYLWGDDVPTAMTRPSLRDIFAAIKDLISGKLQLDFVKQMGKIMGVAPRPWKNKS